MTNEFNIAKSYKIVRDETVCNPHITLAEGIAILEVIKTELANHFNIRVELEL